MVFKQNKSNCDHQTIAWECPIEEYSFSCLEIELPIFLQEDSDVEIDKCHRSPFFCPLCWIFVNFIVYCLKRHHVFLVIHETSTNNYFFCLLHSLYLNSIKTLHTFFDTH